MFRKHFENIVPFSEIILVLLQAYGFIISTSVCMFHIHACQCLVRGTRSSACKMGEQAVWAFTMDDCCRHDRTGDTICGADGFRIPCHAWWFRAVINILVYTPCFSLISMGIYNIETTRSNLRKMILMCSGISFSGSQFSLCRLPSFPPPYYI